MGVVGEGGGGGGGTLSWVAQAGTSLHSLGRLLFILGVGVVFGRIQVRSQDHQ